MASDVLIIAAGGSNLNSVRFALERLGASCSVSGDPDDIGQASRVILPGVGAAAAGMRALRERGCMEAVREFEGPLLGVCLGMQLMTEWSAEQDTACLGLFSHKTLGLKDCDSNLRVPHMGWNRVNWEQEHPILAGAEQGSFAYFVHSYYVEIGNDTLATTDYGKPLSAMLARDNRVACQFHPERSARFGSTILKNFMAMPT